jgi:tetrapyrrole methylase family protein/MazG family protein
LVHAAEEDGEVVYAVPGSPYVLERSVRHLLADPRVDVRIVPGLSFLDLAYGRLGIDPVEAGVRLVDGHEFATAAAGERGPMLVAHAHRRGSSPTSSSPSTARARTRSSSSSASACRTRTC